MRRPAPAWIVAAVGAAVFLVLEPRSTDLVAQIYRAEVARDGIWLWDAGWYAGHHLPAYSVLYPPLGALLGAHLVGALSVLAATVLVERLCARHRPDAGALPSVWFAVVACAGLWTGRVTFFLGLAVGLAAMLALARGRRVLAAVIGALSALASPVAGLFAALAFTAWGLGTGRWRAGAGLAVAALAPIVVLNVLFGEGGTFPFAVSAFWTAFLATVLIGLVLPDSERVLRVGCILYAVLLVLAFALSTAVGGNATRLGWLLSGPVLAVGLRGRRDVLVAVGAVPLLYWSFSPPIADQQRAHGDAALTAAFHAPLVRWLQAREATEGPFRVEVVPTWTKGEALYVARHIPIARGWERQLDRADAPFFYEDRLAPAAYRRWLRARAVRYVALPDAQLDPTAGPEARLVRRPPGWLRDVARLPGWRVLEVTGAPPLATGAARVTAVGPSSVTLRADRAGAVRVRVRFSRWWRVSDGDATVSGTPDGFLRVDVRRPGVVRIAVDLA